MSNCEICPLVEGQSQNDPEVLLQTQRWNVVLDENQEYLGKSFVTLREHTSTISDLDQDDWQELHDVMRRLESAMKSAFHADVLNWSCLMNNAIVAGQSTHVHWHLHPRYLNGTKFAGEEFPDPTWPLRREKVPKIVSKQIFDRIANEIRENL